MIKKHLGYWWINVSKNLKKMNFWFLGSLGPSEKVGIFGWLENFFSNLLTKTLCSLDDQEPKTSTSCPHLQISR